jgi:hypothetical protein
MTQKWLLLPIDKELAKEQWNKLMKRRTTLRRLKRKYPTPQYQAKLEVYKDFFQDNREIPKIIVQYLKGKLVEKVGGIQK